MEKKKWMKQLPSSIIRTVLHIDLDMHVEVTHCAPISTMVHLHCSNGKYAQGIAICSTLDKWDYRTGKLLAFSRAIRALLTEKKTDRIRKTITRKWKPSQDKRVRDVPYRFKSFYSKGETT